MNDSNQALVPLADIEKMAAAVAASKLFGCKTKDEAMALMLVAQAEGMHPMRAVQEFHIISGRPSRKAEAMLARFQASGGMVHWKTLTDQEATATFSHPQGGEVTISWTLAMAAKIQSREDNQTIKLSEKKVWKEYPRAMLRARCISEGVRTVYPGATGGMYTPEEVEDMGPPKDMGAAEVVTPPRAKSEAAAPAAAPTKPAAEEAEVVQHAPIPEGQRNENPIGESPLRLLRAKLKQASISEQAFCARFVIKNLEELKMFQLNQALAWIQESHGGG